MRGRIANQLIQPPNRRAVQARDGAVVIDPQKQPTPATVGKGGQFGGKTIGIGGIALELVAAVFSAADRFLKVGSFHRKVIVFRL